MFWFLSSTSNIYSVDIHSTSRSEILCGWQFKTDSHMRYVLSVLCLPFGKKPHRSGMLFCLLRFSPPQNQLVKILSTSGSAPPPHAQWAKMHFVTGAIWQTGVLSLYGFPALVEGAWSCDMNLKLVLGVICLLLLLCQSERPCRLFHASKLPADQLPFLASSPLSTLSSLKVFLTRQFLLCLLYSQLPRPRCCQA